MACGRGAAERGGSWHGGSWDGASWDGASWDGVTPGGEEFLDPAITRLADAADTGALLFTCRYPLPGTDRLLISAPIPALSGAELRRMFLRLPALRDLDIEDRRLLTRTIGGHPRLIEFTDALLRSRASLKYVEIKLRDLARRTGLDLARDASLETAINQAMLLGSADILLTELLRLLTPRQADALNQIAVCYGAMSPDDLAFALGSADRSPDAITRTDIDRLIDLTLLTPGPDIEMHPWTAAVVTRNSSVELAPLHERALAMRYRRFEQRRGTYDDLIDIPRHLAALGRFDEIGGIASQAVRILPGTLATGAYLAEIHPLLPPMEHAWTVVAELRAEAFLQAGDLPSATRQFQAMYEQDQARAAADPANTQWQRDLSISHDKLGDVAASAVDLAAARASYLAALDIRERLAAMDPVNAQWQRDLEYVRQRIKDLPAD